MDRATPEDTVLCRGSGMVPADMLVPVYVVAGTMPGEIPPALLQPPLDLAGRSLRCAYICTRRCEIRGLSVLVGAGTGEFVGFAMGWAAHLPGYGPVGDRAPGDDCDMGALRERRGEGGCKSSTGLDTKRELAAVFPLDSGNRAPDRCRLAAVSDRMLGAGGMLNSEKEHG